MKRFMNRKVAWIAVALLAVTAIAAPQIDKIIKGGAAVAAVSAFGNQMNDGVNKLWGRKESAQVKTKVVVILSVGLNSSSAVGAAQVMGPPADVDKVVAVAQPTLKVAGFNARALIPVSSKNVIKDIKIVNGVGVSGIIDIRL